MAFKGGDKFSPSLHVLQPTQNEVEKLIAGTGACICGDCVSLAHDAIEDQIPRTNDWSARKRSI